MNKQSETSDGTEKICYVPTAIKTIDIYTFFMNLKIVIYKIRSVSYVLN